MKTGDRTPRRKRKATGKQRNVRGSGKSGEQVYCLECGATLENFCFSEGADDLAAIRKTLAQCRKKGKFSGDFCSKLFIAHPDAVTVPDDEPDA